MTSCRGSEPNAGIEGRDRQEARAEGLGQLRAQESLDSCVDVPSCGDQGLQVGLTIDEAHGVELLQLLLKSHFWRLHLEGTGLLKRAQDQRQGAYLILSVYNGEKKTSSESTNGAGVGELQTEAKEPASQVTKQLCHHKMGGIFLKISK